METFMSVRNLPAPPVPPDLDLQKCHYMPIDVVRFRDSRFAFETKGEEFRAGMLLRFASWHQKPASSLPNDDAVLARLAGFGRDLEAWHDVKRGALHGWEECSDGRLYHPEIVEKALEADRLLHRKHEQTKAATQAKRKRCDEDRDDHRHDNRDDQRHDDRDDHQRKKRKETVRANRSYQTMEREARGIDEEPSPSAPDSLSGLPEKVLRKASPAGLKALGHPLPGSWTPDGELCEDVKREFGMTDEDIRTELYAFHAEHAAKGTYSANWRASFKTWCKRWKEHRDKQAPPRIEVTRATAPPPKKPEDFTEAEWDGIVRLYAQTGRWARDAGPDPLSRACKCPRHVLERYEIGPETGEKRRVASRFIEAGSQ
jgi:hypothetical protein